ncbi:hypothetical protein Fcan01_24302 [Folsomia candida]|uniref:Uncharacterized protein n=1 Tax=Folsomia candida TaxID=158441 RepID=A0A226D5X0_FOLCA|nr:hypothetical protein Fcan01_24302 [Folsomia candida]
MPGYLSDISVQGDSSSSIYLFGWGGSTSNIIYKCNPLINVTAYVGQIPLVPRYSITTTLRKAEGSEEILIFEGQSHYHRVSSFNMSTLIATEKGSLVPGLRSATSVRVGGKAYLFGIAAPHNSAFQVLDLETLEGPVFDVGFFPFNHAPEVVYNGENIYILGGNRGPPSRGILQLDPNSYEWRLVPVDNFQLQDEDYYYDVAPVPIYVEKLGRIYFFGGKVMNRYTGETIFPRDVWYLDLAPVRGNSAESNEQNI